MREEAITRCLHSIGLEEDADAHLHLPFGRLPGAADAAEIGIRDGGVRICELRRVGYVEHFSPQFRFQALGEAERLEERYVTGPQTGTIERIAARGALAIRRCCFVESIRRDPVSADALG